VPDFAAIAPTEVCWKPWRHLGWCGVPWGSFWLAIKVIMIIMTSVGNPMGEAHSLSTGEIILFGTG